MPDVRTITRKSWKYPAISYSNLRRRKISAGFKGICLSFVLLSVTHNSSAVPPVADLSPPISYMDGCHLTVREFLPKPCVYGILNSKVIVYLVGDSHAAQWLPALIDAGFRNGWQIRSLTKSGCPAANMPMYPECNRWNDEIIKEIRLNKPDFVYISNLTNQDHQISKNKRNYGVYFRAGFSKMLASISTETSVRVIEDTPYPNFDVKICYESNPLLDCNFSNQTSSITKLSKLITRKYGADWLPTNSFFCQKELCSVLKNGTPLYRDRSHISAEASRFLTHLFK